MDDCRFDSMTKHLVTERSRRRFLRGLAGGAAVVLFGRTIPEATARCGRVGDDCRRRRDCCAGARCLNSRCRCKPGRADCAGNGRCKTDLRSDADNCGACGRSCDTANGETCVDGACVPPPEACQAGEDVCLGNESHPVCNNEPGCHCHTEMSGGATRCGRVFRPCADSVCTSDADCGLEAFCARKTGTICCTNLEIGDGFCVLPCR